MRAIALAAVCTIACGSAPPPVPPVVHRADAPPTILEIHTAEGATALESVCDADLQERCNAIDDDCDQTIDEGCAVPSGELVIAMTWNSGSDLDLTVEAPEGAVAEVTSAHGRCDMSGTIERAAYAHAPAGTWRIGVRHAAACDDSAPSTAAIAVQLGDRMAGVFDRTLQAGESAQVVELVVQR